MRDLGSSNGTKLNGKSLFPGDRAALAPGNRIDFGDGEESWTLVDAEPPQPCAVLLGPQCYAWGAGMLLVLPNEDAPEASVFVGDDSWLLDTGSEVRPIECGDLVSLRDGYFRILVPESSGSPRARTAGPELDLTAAALSFSVAPERISVQLRHGSVVISIPSRACLNTLVALARVRMRSEGVESQRGWIAAADLAESMRYTQEKLNVDIHRLRKLFQDANVRLASQIVERDDAKRVRLGIQTIEEVTHGLHS